MREEQAAYKQDELNNIIKPALDKYKDIILEKTIAEERKYYIDYELRLNNYPQQLMHTYWLNFSINDFEFRLRVFAGYNAKGRYIYLWFENRYHDNDYQILLFNNDIFVADDFDILELLNKNNKKVWKIKEIMKGKQTLFDV